MGTNVYKGASCWSCLAINEQGTLVCPLCGADQTRPVAIPNATSPRSSTGEWSSPIFVILAGIGCLAGILWYNLGDPSASPASETAEVAAKSLRDVREALSTYMLSQGVYPATLDPLGDQVGQPLQSAYRAGYKIQYIPKPSTHNGSYGGFVIFARPENGHYLNFYIDESGVVRTTQENRPATERDPPL